MVFVSGTLDSRLGNGFWNSLVDNVMCQRDGHERGSGAVASLAVELVV